MRAHVYSGTLILYLRNLRSWILIGVSWSLALTRKKKQLCYVPLYYIFTFGRACIVADLHYSERKSRYNMYFCRARLNEKLAFLSCTALDTSQLPPLVTSLGSSCYSGIIVRGDPFFCITSHVPADTVYSIRGGQYLVWFGLLNK